MFESQELEFFLSHEYYQRTGLRRTLVVLRAHPACRPHDHRYIYPDYSFLQNSLLFSLSESFPYVFLALVLGLSNVEFFEH